MPHFNLLYICFTTNRSRKIHTSNELERISILEIDIVVTSKQTRMWCHNYKNSHFASQAFFVVFMLTVKRAK